ncbi:hypothetical protein A616_28735 [Brevibacillus brevis X23]|nr:hypothetical protein A616_28735 [Brevibacillus brevis X23]
MATQLDKRYIPLRLMSVESEGFSYFPRQEILIHEGITLLNGPNGSGKTTFLNLIRLIYGIKKFDNTTTLKSFFERENVNEIYILGRFDNTIHPVYGRRPFEPIGKHQDVVTVVCRLIDDYPNPNRDYLIFDGKFELEEHLRGALRWLEVGQYIRQLEEVGVSRALVNSFSLTQGNTEKLFELTPEALADYILQICGEQERIEDFQRIKVDLKRQKEEYHRLLLQKQQEEANARKIADRIQRCKAILTQKECIRDAQDNMLLAAYKEGKEKLDELHLEWDRLITELQTLDAEMYQLGATLEQLGRERDLCQKDLDQIRETNRTTQEQIFNLGNQILTLEDEFKDLLDFIQLYEHTPLLSLEHLEQEEASVETQYQNALLDLRQVERSKNELEKQIEKIERTKSNSYPPQVQQMIQVLEDKRVSFLLLAEHLEIVDSEWREAIEALLGEERFTVVVPEKQVVSVMRWAQQIKYPFWISPYATAKLKKHPSSVLAKVEILDDRVSAYLLKFESYMVANSMDEAWDWVKEGKQALLNTPSPYKVVNRGGRSIRVSGIYCGKRAYEAQLSQLKKEWDDVLICYKNQSDIVSDYSHQFATVKQTIEEQKNARLVPDKRGLSLVVQGKMTQTHEDLNEYKKIFENNREMELKLFEKLTKVSVSLSLTHRDKDTATNKRLESHEKKVETDINLSSQKEIVSQRFNNLSEEAQKLVHDSERMLNLGTIQEYENQIRVATKIIETHRKDLQGLDFIPEGEEERIAALERNHQIRQRMLNEHINEIREVESELRELEIRHGDAQEEYHAMVEEVLYKVKRSLESLAESKNILATLEISCQEDKWSIDYKIGFNGKTATSYRKKGGFSGGEKVIASLLLTFAAIKADGMLNFMILDEPFAHLDQDRIKMAGEFLRATGIQYIIAMPYSENMKLFIPWIDMLINVRPKKVDSLMAPPVTYGVINNEYIRANSLYKASS